METVKAKNDFILQSVKGENVLFPVGEALQTFNGIVTLNDTGAFLWKCLSDGKSVSALLREVVTVFEVEPEQARLDIQEFLEDALKWGLIEVTA